ncbi:hypothetical protein OAJ69_04600 [Pseudomonadota bacterium]|nr:hypothetical protein [Pseudomonadota bacterium]
MKTNKRNKIKKYKEHLKSKANLWRTTSLNDCYSRWTSTNFVKEKFKTYYGDDKFHRLPYHLANNRDFIRELLIQNEELRKGKEGGYYLPDLLKHLPIKIREDYDVMKIAMRDNGQCSKYLGPNLQKNKNFFLEILRFYKKHPSTLKYYDFIYQNMDQNLIKDKKINQLLCSIGVRLPVKSINLNDLSKKKCIKKNIQEFSHVNEFKKLPLSIRSDREIASMAMDNWVEGAHHRRDLFKVLPPKLRKNKIFVKSEIDKDVNIFMVLTKALQFDPLIYFHALNKNPDLVFSIFDINSDLETTLRVIKKINFQILDLGSEKKLEIFNTYKKGFKNIDVFMLAELKQHICKPFNITEVKKINLKLSNYKLLRNFNKKKFLSYLSKFQPYSRGYGFIPTIPQVDVLYLNLSYRLKVDHEVVPALIRYNQKYPRLSIFSSLSSNFERFIKLSGDIRPYWKEMLSSTGHGRASLPIEILQKINLANPLILKRAILSDTDHVTLWNRMQHSDQKNFKYQKLLLKHSMGHAANELLKIFLKNTDKLGITNKNLLKLTSIVYDGVGGAHDNYLYNRKYKAQVINTKFIMDRITNNYNNFDCISDMDLYRVRHILKKNILQNFSLASAMVEKTYGSPPTDYSKKKHSRFTRLPTCIKNDKEVVTRLLQIKISIFKYLPANLQLDPDILKFVLLFKPSYVAKCNIKKLLNAKIDLCELPMVTKKAIKTYLSRATSRNSSKDIFEKAFALKRINSMLGIII